MAFLGKVRCSGGFGSGDVCVVRLLAVIVRIEGLWEFVVDVEMLGYKSAVRLAGGRNSFGCGGVRRSREGG